MTVDLSEYQKRARATEQMPSAEGVEEIVPLLGLAGEVGELLNEYKKLLRDGSAHVRFRERLAEELGDLLWYAAETATKFKLDLNDVAERNLAKTQAR
jgi:NTP pyrophosphatase (non-canonical NTP hydrolase)